MDATDESANVVGSSDATASDAPAGSVTCKTAKVEAEYPLKSAAAPTTTCGELEAGSLVASVADGAADGSATAELVVALEVGEADTVVDAGSDDADPDSRGTTRDGVEELESVAVGDPALLGSPEALPVAPSLGAAGASP